MIFWVCGRNCIVKNEKYIVFSESWYVNSNPDMMYGSWDIEHNEHKFLTFWTVFCPFTPLTTKKIKTLKNWKKLKKKNTSSFYINVPKIIIICYNVPEIRCVMDVILIFYFGLFFALLQFLKNKKNSLEISSFYICTKNNNPMVYGSWNIQVGAPPKDWKFNLIQLKL